MASSLRNDVQTTGLCHWHRNSLSAVEGFPSGRWVEGLTDSWGTWAAVLSALTQQQSPPALWRRLKLLNAIARACLKPLRATLKKYEADQQNC